MFTTTAVILLGLIIYIATYYTYGKYIKNRIVKHSDKEVPSKDCMMV